MLQPGICSLTLRTCTPLEVIQLAFDNGLVGIEWWGGEHVRPGDLEAARTIGRATREAGLAISTYGSYHRVGVTGTENPAFESVLETAVALGAPSIRVWAGDRNREAADQSFIEKVLAETNRLADLAASAGVSLTIEFHGGTLTNTNANAAWLAQTLPHRNVSFSWQPPHGFEVGHCLAGLRSLLPRLGTVHVFHWTIGSFEKNLWTEAERKPLWPDDFHRHPLTDGSERWASYFQLAHSAAGDRFALLEFVRDDSPQQAAADARTLVALCRQSAA